jgi:hypothetical protein
MGYDIFNAIAHLAMLLLVLWIFVFMTVPALALGLGGLFGLRLARRKLGGPLERARSLPPAGYKLVDRACDLAAWPVIQTTSLWRGIKAGIASLRRQVAQR